MAFSNYLELIPNMTEYKTLNRDKTFREQHLPIYINISCYDTTLSDRTTKLKEYNYICNNNDKEFFDLQRRHPRHTFSPNKNFFLDRIVNIFTFTSSIISIITITLVIYLFCKHKHIRTVVGSLLLYKAKEVEARTTMKIDHSGCGTLAYIGIALTLLSMAIVILLHYRKSTFCRGHRFSNIVKIVLFISDVQHYIPITTLQDVRKSSLIQNHRHINITRYKTKQKLLVGQFRNKLG